MATDVDVFCTAGMISVNLISELFSMVRVVSVAERLSSFGPFKGEACRCILGTSLLSLIPHGTTCHNTISPPSRLVCTPSLQYISRVFVALTLDIVVGCRLSIILLNCHPHHQALSTHHGLPFAFSANHSSSSVASSRCQLEWYSM